MNNQQLARELIKLAKSIQSDNRVARDDVDSMVKKLGELQSAKVSTLNETGPVLYALDVGFGSVNSKLKAMIKSSKDKETTCIEIVQALRKHKINTGELESRLTNEIEKYSGETIYPTPWSYEKSRWEITSR